MSKNQAVQIARIISTFGHPFITYPIFILMACYIKLDFKNATWVSALIIMGFFVPIILLTILRNRQGKFSDLDVSNRIQRKLLFYVAIPLLSLITFVLYMTQPTAILYQSAGFGLILVIVSSLVNFLSKCSMHVSLNIYLGTLAFPISHILAVIILLFTFLIGWSRFKLKRHNVKEILLGASIGMMVSLALFFYTNFFGLI